MNFMVLYLESAIYIYIYIRLLPKEEIRFLEMASRCPAPLVS